MIKMMTIGINPNNAYIPAKPSCAETLLNAIIEKIIMERMDNKPKMKKKDSWLEILFEVEFFMVWDVFTNEILFCNIQM